MLRILGDVFRYKLLSFCLIYRKMFSFIATTGYFVPFFCLFLYIFCFSKISSVGLLYFPVIREIDGDDIAIANINV